MIFVSIVKISCLRDKFFSKTRRIDNFFNFLLLKFTAAGSKKGQITEGNVFKIYSSVQGESFRAETR